MKARGNTKRLQPRLGAAARNRGDRHHSKRRKKPPKMAAEQASNATIEGSGTEAVPLAAKPVETAQLMPSASQKWIAKSAPLLLNALIRVDGVQALVHVTVKVRLVTLVTASPAWTCGDMVNPASAGTLTATQIPPAI